MNRSPITAAALIALATLVLAAPRTDAGAWTRPAGGWFVKVGFDRWFTEERFDMSGQRIPFQAPDPGFFDPSEYRSQVLRTYVEYGLVEGLTLTAATSLEWMEAEGGGSVREGGGLGDLYVSLRRRLVPEPVVLSIQADAKLPTGYDETDSPALGTGEVDYGGRLLAGVAHGPLYVTAEGGYVVRGGAFADMIPVALETGYALNPTFALRGEMRASFTRNRIPTGNPTFDPALADAKSVVGSLGVVLRGEPFDFVVTADHMLDGENTLAGTRYTFSIWYER